MSESPMWETAHFFGQFDSWFHCLFFADYFDEDAEEEIEKDCDNEDAENKEEVNNFIL